MKCGANKFARESSARFDFSGLNPLLLLVFFSNLGPFIV